MPRQKVSSTVPIIDTSPEGGHVPLVRTDLNPASPADVATPAANLDAVVAYGAQQQTQQTVAGVAWSYSSAPTGGKLEIFDAPGNLLFSVDITASGPGSIVFDSPKASGPGRTLIIKLAAGGGTVVGKVNALGHRAVQLPIAPSNLSLDFSQANDSGFIPVLGL